MKSPAGHSVLTLGKRLGHFQRIKDRILVNQIFILQVAKIKSLKSLTLYEWEIK